MNIQTAEAPPQRFDIFTGILKAGGGDGEPMTLSGVASSNVEDLHGDTIERSALKDMEGQVANGLTIFLNHSYQVPEDVAGYTDSAKMRKRGEDGDGNAVWDLDMDISINDENPRAVEAWRGIRKKGAKVGLSIGANIPKGGYEVDRKTGAKTIKRINLLETSIVGIPANPRSWISKAVEAIEHEPDSLHDLMVHAVLEAEEVKEAPPADDRDEDDTALAGEAEPELVETSPDQPDVQEDDSTPDADPSDPGSEVETADASAETSGVSPLEGDTAVVEAAIESLDQVEGEVNATHLQMAVDIGRALAEQLVDARKSRDEALRAKAEAERERDEAIEQSSQVLAQTAEIVEAVGKMPLGRKTFIKEAQRKLAHLETTYGPEFMRMLEK